MLLKPVTALAFSAFISFIASSAVAAPTTTSDGKALTASVKTLHGKKAGKKKKLGHLALGHSAEPKTSPKLAASTAQPLEIKKASDKGASSKKPSVVATGKETFIGGPIAHGSGYKAGVKTGGVHANASTGTGKIHASKLVAMKSGREPSHAESVAKDVKVAPKAPCFHEPIEVVRGAESETFSLTSCTGAVAPLADERFSVLVRPESAPRPAAIASLAKVKGAQISPGIRRVDAGLVERVQLIADHFTKPGQKTRISVVSGYRPASTGSFHATAQALDFHIDGVSNEALVEFCKTLEDTGCGYYPNSSFVHVDVRAPKTGHVAWIDASGPGESPRYVATWPPPPDPDVKVAREDDDTTKPDALPPLPGEATTADEARTPAASLNEPFHVKDWE